MSGILVSGRDKDGVVAQGHPVAIQLDGSDYIMVIETKDKKRVAIKPPKGFVVRDNRWIFEG